MIKSKEIIGPSCLTNAADDEPLFVLRANDELAPIIVHDWATRYYTSKCHQSQVSGGKYELTPRQEAKYREALALVEDMRRWKKTHDQQR